MKDKRKELIIGVIAIGIIVLAAITVAIILLTSKDKPSGDEIAKSLTLDQTSISEEIVIGQESIAVLTAITKNITEELVWASSNEDVATVDASGETAVVTLKSAGSATITVKAGNLGALCQVAVKEVESKITLSQTTLVEGIVKGKTKVVTLTATLENLEGNVEWTVDNDKVASIIGNGETAELTLKGIGEAVVTAKVGEKLATCNVKVNDETSMITLNITNINKQIARGSTSVHTLEATLLNIKDELKWTTSNPQVAKVERIDATKAKVTLVGAGKATITVTDGKVNTTCSVTVTHPTPSITLNKTKIDKTIIKGEVITLKDELTATLKNATSTITWTSTNTNVVTVTKTGTTSTLTLLKGGSATITATCKVDGITYSKKCIVFVEEIEPSITLNKTVMNESIGLEGIKTLTASPIKATLKNATGTITWSSNNPSVAEIPSNGKEITLKSPGTAIITAKVEVNGYSYTASCTITVTQNLPKITVEPESKILTIVAGGTSTTKLKYKVDHASQYTVKWSVNEEGTVATVDSYGNVTAHSDGKAIVTAKLVVNGKEYDSDTCELRVIERTPVVAQKESLLYISIVKGGTATRTLSYTISDIEGEIITSSHAKIGAPIWESNDTSVATVDSSGKVTAKAVGTAEIKLSININGITYSHTSTVNVIAPELKLSSTLINRTISDSGATHSITATVSGAGKAKVGNITWESSNTSVASLTKTTGTANTITLKNNGTAVIKAKCEINGQIYEAKCNVTVTIAKTEIIASTEPLKSIQIGERHTMYINQTYRPNNEQVNWSLSSNLSKISSNALGLQYRGLEPGNATITASVNGVSKTWNLEVLKPIIRSIDMATETKLWANEAYVACTISTSNAKYLTRTWGYSGPLGGATIRVNTEDPDVVSVVFCKSGTYTIKVFLSYNGKAVSETVTHTIIVHDN